MYSFMRNFWRMTMSQPAGLAAVAFVSLLAFLAVCAPLLFSGDPNQITENVMRAPSFAHPFGTDELGRDGLASVVYGARVSLIVGLLAAAAATLLGGLIGAFAGYRGGAFDLIVMRVAEIFQVLPTFILAAVIIALSRPGLPQVIIVIAVLAWPQTARLMRGEVMRIKQMDFVAAARCLGIGDSAILLREIVPNSLAPVLAVGTLIVGQAILLEASLGFLGLSSPEIVSWGRMLNSGQRFLFNAWWLSVFPGTAIFLTVLAFNLAGDALGAAMDPRRSGGERR
jgi:peptide/nickel transport system permease protein